MLVNANSFLEKKWQKIVGEWDFGRVTNTHKCSPAKRSAAGEIQNQQCAFSAAISFGVVRQQPPISFAPAASHCGRYPSSVAQASP